MIIEREVNGPSSLKGYRNIWNKLRLTYGLTSFDKVMEMLRNIDPVNSALGKTKKISKLLRFVEFLLKVNIHCENRNEFSLWKT